ncbi:armadillo-type protein [Baffinella frigidus]|nr:armadillo-type protein [Cryptophyta sp. CCMP2293]
MEKASRAEGGRRSLVACADATPRLVALLASDRTEEARLACKTLASLATDPRGRLAINALPDAIPAVFSVLDSSDLEGSAFWELALADPGQQSALMVIGNLVLDPPSRKRLAQTSGNPPPLFLFLFTLDWLLERLFASLASSDPKTLRFATGALRNLSVDPVGRLRVAADATAVERLRALSSHEDANTARYAAAVMKRVTSMGGEHR